MRNIFLTAVVVCALAVAGIGGVFANYQDIDISSGNTFETGSLDLKVSYGDFLYDSPFIPALIYVENAMPECTDKSFHFDLHNAGNYSQQGGFVYMHVKNLVAVDTGRTEPEDAAELGLTPIGEKLNGTPVYAGACALGEGWGTEAVNPKLAEHIGVTILLSWTSKNGPWVAANLSAYDDNGDGEIKLNELVCKQVYLSDRPYTSPRLKGNLFSGQTLWVWISLKLQDIDEDEDLDPPCNLFDESIYEEAKWEDWPTNALQDDQITFDLSFELFHIPLPPKP